MDMLNNSNGPRSALPSISHLDREKIDNDRSDTDKPSKLSTMSISSALAESKTIYSAPPASYHQLGALNSTQDRSGYISPPESTTRRSTREEYEPPFPAKSLPSIHEALKESSTLPNPFPPSNQAHTTVSTPTLTGPPSSINCQTTASAFHPTAVETSSRGALSIPPLSAVSARSEQSFPESTPTSAVRPDGSKYNVRNHGYLVSPRQSHASPPRPSGHHYPHHNLPMNAPPPSPYQSEFTPSNPSIPQYTPQNAANLAPRQSFGSGPGAKKDEPSNLFTRHSNGSYGDTVRKHLDVYEAEYALNELNDAAARTLDFSQYWSQRYHQSSRFNLITDGLPPLKEIDEMTRHSHRIAESFGQLREIVAVHHATMSEERARAARVSYHNDEYRALNDDYKSSSFSNDAKKRRGKAAPPGRCHSCNRAETPEWRRGPDGARTLCNACGLHYAKLTRKLSANKPVPLTGSNIRPKAMESRQ